MVEKKIHHLLPHYQNKRLPIHFLLFFHYYIDKFEKDYEIKLFVKHHSKHKFVNIDNFNFIVNEGNIEKYLLLFTHLKNFQMNKFKFKKNNI